MSNIEHIESKVTDMNMPNSLYKVGNSFYVVKSHFAGKEKIDDLIFNILCKKSAVHNAENSK